MSRGLAGLGYPGLAALIALAGCDSDGMMLDDLEHLEIEATLHTREGKPDVLDVGLTFDPPSGGCWILSRPGWVTFGADPDVAAYGGKNDDGDCVRPAFRWNQPRLGSGPRGTLWLHDDSADLRRDIDLRPRTLGMVSSANASFAPGDPVVLQFAPELPPSSVVVSFRLDGHAEIAWSMASSSSEPGACPTCTGGFEPDLRIDGPVIRFRAPRAATGRGALTVATVAPNCVPFAACSATTIDTTTLAVTATP